VGVHVRAQEKKADWLRRSDKTCLSARLALRQSPLAMALTFDEQKELIQKIQLLEFPDLMHVLRIVNDGREPTSDEAFDLDIATLPVDKVIAIHAFVNRDRVSDEDETLPAPLPSPEKKKRQSTLTQGLTLSTASPVKKKKEKKGKKDKEKGSGRARGRPRSRPPSGLLDGAPPGANGAHVCADCGKGFKRPSALAEHRVKHNTDGRNPFQCQTCGAFMSNSANLRRHMRVHTGARPFTCMHCGEAFAQSGNCKAHEFRCDFAQHG